MPVDWPSNLPFSVQYGMQMTLGGVGGKATTEFDYGPRKSRKRFTNQPILQRLSFTFTDDEFEAFKNFYYGQLEEGVRSFTAPVITGNSIQDRLCTIIDDTVESSANTYNNWSVVFNIEVRDFYQASEATAWLISFLGVESFEDISDVLQVAVNTTWYNAYQNSL